MKITTIADWSPNVLERIQEGLNDSTLVLIRGKKFGREEYAEFLSGLGEPSFQFSGHRSTVLTIGEHEYSETGNWYDKTMEFTLHFDGIRSIPERKVMPLTILHAANLSDVVGGQTYFHSLDDLYRNMMSDPFMRTISWRAVLGQYTHDPAVAPVSLPALRHSPYSGNPYILIDEWFTKRLDPGPTMSLPDGIVEMYRNLFQTTQRYHHIWDPDDTLIWSNESFVHGRTEILSGTRVMWRGIVWDNHLLQTGKIELSDHV